MSHRQKLLYYSLFNSNQMLFKNYEEVFGGVDGGGRGEGG